VRAKRGGHEDQTQRLEGIHQPADERFTFHIAKPPDGLTHAQEEEWREQQRQDWEARGIPWFTLDLSSGGAGLREVEP
jgi:hypothetical protein